MRETIYEHLMCGLRLHLLYCSSTHNGLQDLHANFWLSQNLQNTQPKTCSKFDSIQWPPTSARPPLSGRTIITAQPGT